MSPTSPPVSPGSSPGTLESLAPVLVLVGLLIAAAAGGVLSGDTLVLVILASAAVAIVVSHRHGAGWEDVQRATGQRIAAVLPALLILLAIGMLISSWMAAGTIAWLVHAGIGLVRPDMLFITAFLATCLMSLCTGTSWGSAGTVGVALVGVAAALDAPLGITAGAIVSGAYFGDKLSPLSDSTNICAIAAGTPLYRHIRHMLYTAGPSFLVAAALYVALGTTLPGGERLPPDARLMLGELDAAFSLSTLTLLPVVVVVGGIVARVPPAIAISGSALVALLLGATLQDIAFTDLAAAAVTGFRADMIMPAGSASDALRTVVERGGLYSMATTLVIVIAAFLLAAGMETSGALDHLVRALLAAARSTLGLVASTMAAGATMIALTSHGGVTSLVIGGMFRPAYLERGLAPENLSRSLEDSVTITEPLMPWTVSAVFMATTLGVSTVHYAPWAFFCIGGPLFSLLAAATGYGVRRLPVPSPPPVPTPAY